MVEGEAGLGHILKSGSFGEILAKIREFMVDFGLNAEALTMVCVLFM